MDIYDIIREIAPLDGEAMDAAKGRQAELAKPPGSLGRLEELSVQLAGITGNPRGSYEDRRILVFCADNGVVSEGVSSAPRSVTYSQSVNMTRGVTGMSALAKFFGCRVVVADVGMACESRCEKILDLKIARGTKNLAKEPAMTRGEAERAMLTGAKLAMEQAADGAQILGIGEMGIGNTTTSSAVLSALTRLPAERTTGRGGGLTDAAFFKKLKIIDAALALHRPDADDPINVISLVGGLDIAAMCGAFLGAAAARRPVVVDGFISVVAALCASRLCPLVNNYLIPSHGSAERGFMLAAQELSLKPYLDLDMRLGEGSGCPLAFEVVRAASAVMNTMATFAEASIDDGYLEEIRNMEK